LHNLQTNLSSAVYFSIRRFSEMHQYNAVGIALVLSMLRSFHADAKTESAVQDKSIV